jgi:hypothetical protein
VQRYNLPAFQILSARGGPLYWFRYMLSSGTDKEKCKKSGKVEPYSPSGGRFGRNVIERFFYHKEASVLQVSTLIQEAIHFQGLAWNRN